MRAMNRYEFKDKYLFSATCPVCATIFEVFNPDAKPRKNDVNALRQLASVHCASLDIRK